MIDIYTCWRRAERSDWTSKSRSRVASSNMSSSICFSFNFFFTFTDFENLPPPLLLLPLFDTSRSGFLTDFGFVSFFGGISLLVLCIGKSKCLSIFIWIRLRGGILFYLDFHKNAETRLIYQTGFEDVL